MDADGKEMSELNLGGEAREMRETSDSLVVLERLPSQEGECEPSQEANPRPLARR